jgi:hypothetical protein
MAILPIAPAILPDGCKAIANSQNEIKRRLALGRNRMDRAVAIGNAWLVLSVLLRATLAARFALLRRPSAWRSAVVGLRNASRHRLGLMTQAIAEGWPIIRSVRWLRWANYGLKNSF